MTGDSNILIIRTADKLSDNGVRRLPSSTLYFQILDGFVMILSSSGEILHVSESIRDALDHAPHAIVGENIQTLVNGLE